MAAKRKTATNKADVAAAAVDQEAVLARWRTTRSPRLADILCAVPVDAKWVARLAGVARSDSDAARRKIKELPDDPRTALFLMQMLAKARWSGSFSKNLWKLAFERLATLRDVRALEPLRAMVITPPYFLGAAYTKWVVEQIAATADALAKLPRVKDDAATTRLADAQQVTIPKGGWFAKASNESADALIAKVWAAPDDLPLRSVIGDALQELGDPWGDFIALSVRGGKTNAKAIAALVRKHGGRFAGAINLVGSRAKMTFEHGFLAGCEIGRAMTGRRKWEDVIVAKQWATVTSVAFNPWGGIPRWWFKDWFSKADLRSLREIVVDNIKLAREQAKGPWKITKLPKRYDGHVEDTFGAVLCGMPLAELRRIAKPAVPKAQQQVADAIEAQS